jgi:MFS family permease
MTIVSAWLHFSGWVALLVALPFLAPGENPRTLAVFFTVLSVVALSGAINGVAWNAWMQECIPVRLRGKYFGFRNRLLYLSQFAFMLGVSGLLAWLNGRLLAYQLLFGGAILLRIISVLAQQRMLGSTSSQAPVPEPPWRVQLGVVWRDVALVRFIVFASVMGFATNLVGPFFPVFMFEELHLSAAYTNLLILLGVVGAALTFPAWGRLLDRHGNVPVMIVAVILWQFTQVLMGWSNPHNIWLLYVIMSTGGFFLAGYGIGLFGLLLKLTPPGARTMGMALFISLSSLAAAFGPITGGYLITAAIAHGFSPLAVYHLAFFASAILITLCCFLLHRVREPNSDGLSEVVGAMRNVRTVASLFGLSFLVNQVFIRAPGRGASRPAKAD